MRSNISFQARNCLRGVAARRTGASFGRVAARRWYSEARQWSTPLAKQLSEAITVYHPALKSS